MHFRDALPPLSVQKFSLKLIAHMEMLLSLMSSLLSMLVTTTSSRRIAAPLSAEVFVEVDRKYGNVFVSDVFSPVDVGNDDVLATHCPPSRCRGFC